MFVSNEHLTNAHIQLHIFLWELLVLIRLITLLNIYMQVVGSGCFFESLYRTYSSQVLQAITISPDLKIKMFETWPNVLRSYLISVIVYLVKSSDCTIALTIVPAQRRPASMMPLPLNSLRAFWICSLSASAPLPQTAVEGPLVHPHSEVWIPIIPGWCAVPQRCHSAADQGANLCT